MKAFIQKLTSRKFLACVAGIVLGACMIFGLDMDAVNTVAGAVTTVGSVVIYIYSEGKIDAASLEKIKDAAEKVEDAVDVVVEIEE